MTPSIPVATPRLYSLWRVSWITILAGYSLIFIGGILTIVVGIYFEPHGQPFPVPFWLWLELLIATIGMFSGTALVILTTILQAITNSSLPFFPRAIRNFFVYPSPAPQVVEPALPIATALPPRVADAPAYFSYAGASGSSNGFWIAILVIVVILLLYR